MLGDTLLTILWCSEIEHHSIESIRHNMTLNYFYPCTCEGCNLIKRSINTQLAISIHTPAYRMQQKQFFHNH